jgi:competence protein ComEC
MKRPHGNANPHGFDYEAWLLEQNVRATGSVRPDQGPASTNQRLDSFVLGIGNGLQRVRGWMRERIQAALPGKEYAGVIVALVVGDQRAISQSDWKIFNRTGIGHLVSISGLHITMIAGLFAGLVFALWRRSFFSRAEFPTLLPAQKAAALAGACAALAYVALAGFGIPAQRTLYMLSVVALALWTGRIASVSHVLCAALGTVVVLDPWAVMWPGFWLSFGAVATILYASTGRTRAHAPEPAIIGLAEDSPGSPHWLASLRTAAHTQYVVTLGLVPLTMLLFGQISLVSPIANAFAIPLVSFVVTPLALAGSVLPGPFSPWLLRAAHWCVEQLALALTWLSELPAAVWTAPVPSWWIFLLATAGTLWLLAPRGWPLRWLGLAGWLPLLVNAPAHPDAGEMWITAFDVGQGTAVLIETPRHRLLYDTGPAYSPDADGGIRVILPYLKGRGVDRLDAVIVSHSDADHSGGALSIFDEIEVGWVSSSLPGAHPLVKAAPGHRRCEAGQSWTWDAVRFEMLHPSPVSYASAKWKPNARSCTLKITAGKHSILLPGDIEAVQETELVESDAAHLKASVLLAPHHGSGTSSTLPFLNAVQPDIALFQVGYRNRYRHPKQEVFDRYGELGIRRLRTDESGALTFRFGESLSVAEYRNEYPRYWHGR